MGFLKKFFGLIFGIFGILFGGVWDTIVGAFVGSEETQEPTAMVTPAPAPAPGPIPTPVPMPAPAPVPVAVAPEKAEVERTEEKPTVVPVVPGQMAAPKPRRRPGKTMAMFKEMARDLPSARRG